MESNIRQLQLCELAILKEFAELCDKFGLKYYLAEGTLLGAIRHKGFIPWDDDVDVCMPREDYETFIHIAEDALPENMHLECYRVMDTEEKNIVPRLGVYDEGHKMLWNYFGPERISPVSIDILPIDGFPTGKLEGLLHQVNLLFNLYLLRCSQASLINTERKLALWKRVGIRIAIWLHLERMNTNAMCRSYDEALKKYPYCQSEMTISSISEYRKRTRFPKNYYGEGRMASFEGCLFRIPSKAEEILKAEYGDYMQLPPPEDRRPKHQIKLITAD